MGILHTAYFWIIQCWWEIQHRFKAILNQYVFNNIHVVQTRLKKKYTNITFWDFSLPFFFLFHCTPHFTPFCLVPPFFSFFPFIFYSFLCFFSPFPVTFYLFSLKLILFCGAGIVCKWSTSLKLRRKMLAPRSIHLHPEDKVSIFLRNIDNRSFIQGANIKKSIKLKNKSRWEPFIFLSLCLYIASFIICKTNSRDHKSKPNSRWSKRKN